MSIFNELLPQLNAISAKCVENFQKELQGAIDYLENFEKEYDNGRNQGKEKAPMDKVSKATLQSIIEDDGDPNKVSKNSSSTDSNGEQRRSKKRTKNEAEDILSPEVDKRLKRSASVKAQTFITKQGAIDYLENFEKEYDNGRNQGKEKAPMDKVSKATLQSIIEDDGDPNKVSKNSSSTDSNGEQRRSKKRTKNEAEDILSPEVDKRLKRSASVKAQTFITKQVNVNLSAKLRREKSTDSVQVTEKPEKAPKGWRRKDNKENAEPNMPASVPTTQIKEEKISLPPEMMDMDSLPVDIPVKQEPSKDEMAMPPPALPKPKSRKAPLAQEKSESNDEETTAGRRTARNKKQPADGMPPPPTPVAGSRATRASSRVRTTQADDLPPPPPPDPKPKRTRAKKKVSVSEAQTSEVDGGLSLASQETVSVTASPAEKPRPKRTRRGKANDKQEPPKPAEPVTTISPKEEPTSTTSSPILGKDIKSKKKGKPELTSISIHSTLSHTTINSSNDSEDTKVAKDLDKTRLISKELDKTKIIIKDLDKTQVLSKDMDKTMVLTNGVYNHEPVSPKIISNMNETVLIQKAANETVLLDKPPVMDATVIIEKAGTKSSNLTEDNSLLTEDEDEQFHTPPAKPGAVEAQPSSAVKEKVQQFEELASRVTRTKTRALAKKEGDTQNSDTHTPPDKVLKAGLSADTLHKMNSLIFNGKPQPQVSSSACKPRVPAPAASKSALTASASASKLTSLGRQREAAEEDARKKKEAMLEAKKEQQKRKREEKMAAAALARNNAERDRRLQLEQLAKEKMEKQAHADLGKLERMKEHERKKQELARKAAETEERRRAEEAARAQRLADEQRRALQQRRKQIEEQEAMKKEAAKMTKEIEKRQKEYLDKQRIKCRLEDKVPNPLKTPLKGYHGHMSPVYMADGFQYLNSDSEEEGPPRPVPDWSTSKARKAQLDIQSHVSDLSVSRLFSVRVHTPDLADIFPSIERARLKRTSSAVWRTPPALASLPE